MKKAICTLMILSVLSALAACNAVGVDIYTYDTRNFNEAIGDVSPTSDIDEIVIDWVAGFVHVVTGTQDNITVHESGVGKSASVPLCYKVNNSTMTIAFAKNGTACSNLSKNLTVTIPADKLLTALTVKAVASTVYVDSSVTERIKLEAVSGKVECNLNSVRKVDVETVSASVKVRAAYAKEVNVETMSGALSLNLPSFEELEIETTSGDVNLALSKDASFTMTVSTVSGRLDKGDFSFTVSGNRYIHGTAGNKASVEIETTSGNVSLKYA